MRDGAGKVIYVGKAKDLRSRVRGYLRGGDGRPQIVFLMRQAGDIETLVTGNEKEALILENNLIKQYKPRYNIRLKDDKSYLSIKVTAGPWARVLATRSIVKDGSRYFGPYASAVAVRETLDVIEKHFLLRTCTDYNFRSRDRPCLQYQIKRCPAPCVYPVDPEEYAGNLAQAVLFIEGKSDDLLKHLRIRMQARAEALEFEQAARIRDRIRAVEKTLEKQRMVSHWGADQDIFGLYREGGFIEVQVIFVRQGKLTGNQAYSLEDHQFDDEEIVAALLTQFYQGKPFRSGRDPGAGGVGGPNRSRGLPGGAKGQEGDVAPAAPGREAQAAGDGDEQRPAELQRTSRPGAGTGEDAARVATEAPAAAVSATDRVLRYLDDPGETTPWGRGSRSSTGSRTSSTTGGTGCAPSVPRPAETISP